MTWLVWLNMNYFLIENDKGPFGRRKNISPEKPPVLWKSTWTAGNTRFTSSDYINVCVDNNNSCAVVIPDFSAGMCGYFYLFKAQSYLLVSVLPSEEVITSTWKKKVCIIRRFFHRSVGCWSLQIDWCHLVPCLSGKQREILKMNTIEFPGKRLEMLFWISQK